MLARGMNSFALDDEGNVVFQRISTPSGPDGTPMGMPTLSWVSPARNQLAQEPISSSWADALVSGREQIGSAMPSLSYSGGVAPAAPKRDAYGLDAAVAEWQENFQRNTLPRWEWDLEQERRAVQAEQERQARALDEAVARQAAMFRDYVAHPSYYVRDAQGIRLRGRYDPDMGPTLR